MAISIVVPKEFPYIILSLVVLCFECVVISFVVVGSARKKHFNKKFMEQFTVEHKKHFPETEPSVGGWPDAGDGRYSEKLDYKSWVEFNNSMRVHQNFVEFLPVIAVFLIIGGFVLPTLAMWVGITNAIARPIYTVMYVKFGSNSRALGAIAGSLPLYVLGLSSFVSLARATFAN